ncbi:type III secretion system export apparatus subunit SctV [Halomonas sp. MCCC 1A17488]|uniref:type III secretion system export apparatus subunit SctV n=1 Tax=unclassified Halomonas TaxID=2609666 RepID=UPI0018D2325C|nr:MULTISPECIES: type III secretion system export apparatus subunit SctV [unclassified Halomonas]MCE8016463.1 type III secretion system export apparatus subunit SctV [Halomonas sp. MCCC 1A17488]MCG3239796.1 type III secretion system export apparatus subunit SctV [Halomonas sp. MCCC 1A17488]QPP50303.1 type III secretion system export apparatus subunit SctV [Halomonas sp. SS10-MC5]
MSAVLAKLNLLAQRAAQRSDVVIALFIVLAVVMMIIPLPTTLVDALIGINIGFSLLILVVAFYISHPVEYSSLPPIILLATLFRLALSITTTRLILLDGDAGKMVSAFGNFVIAGEVMIGLVVFLIITVAQFLVITKGAERVAEVAARFILDAMPGKQMSIDNDFRNGDIEQAEARSRRQRLEQESQLYGAMDGAMKFVKGDAIAGLVILCVNLIGGLSIGMVKRGMSFGEAVDTYSLLTVGDGLVAQIPALLIAVGAGTVVTRVSSSSGHSGDLGSEIVGQLGRSARALGLTAVILFFAAFIPGFASGVFLTLAAGLGFAAFVMHRRERSLVAQVDASGELSSPAPLAAGAAPTPTREAATPADEEPAPNADTAPEAGGSHRVVLCLSVSLADGLSLDALRWELDDARRRAGANLGIEMPGVGLRTDAALEADHFAIELDEVPITQGELPAERVLLDDDPVHLELLEVEAAEHPSPLGRHSGHWVAAQEVERLDEAGIGYRRADQVLCLCLERTLARYAGEFVGIQETRTLLSRMEQDYAELVGEAVRVVSLQKISDILRRLVDEGIPLRALRTILEAVVTWGPQEANVPRLTERIRAALSRQICHRFARADRVLPAWVVTRQLEEAIRATQRSADGAARSGSVPAALSRALNRWFQQRLEMLDSDVSPVVVVSADVRPVLQQWAKRHELDLPVIAWSEVAPEFSLQSLAQVRLPQANSRGDGEAASAPKGEAE